MNGISQLRAFRRNHEPKLSQAALAERLGVTRLTVTRWESGARKIDPDLVLVVAAETGIPAKELRPDLLEKHEKIFGEAAQ
jgi:transcriptional regulator with XRE-family HTH domain